MKNEKEVVNDYNQLERMKSLCLNKSYMCNGELYKLLNGDYLPKLLNNIESGNVKISSDLVYGKSIITKEEKFLENLDKYISYVRDKYFIEHIEQYLLIEMSLNNKYNDILYSLEDYHKEENYYKFIDKYRKMFLFNFYDNIKFYSKYVDNISPIHTFLKQIKNYDFDNEKDIIELENIFIKIIRYRNNNLYNAFVPYNEVKKRDYDFYIFQIEWILQDYLKNKYTETFEIKENDNYILIDDRSKLLFNVKSDIKKLKNEDYVEVEFGIKNDNFNAKVSSELFRKKELLDLIKRLKEINNKDKYNMDFIIPILRFKFWCEESHQYLDIRFEYGDNCDYYVICLDENETKKMYELLFQQLNI